jgi:hypothetical protein
LSRWEGSSVVVIAPLESYSMELEDSLPLFAVVPIASFSVSEGISAQ